MRLLCNAISSGTPHCNQACVCVKNEKITPSDATCNVQLTIKNRHLHVFRGSDKINWLPCIMFAFMRLVLFAFMRLVISEITGCFRFSATMSDTEDKPMKAAPSRPPYLQLIKDAITEIGNPKGSSR